MKILTESKAVSSVLFSVDKSEKMMMVEDSTLSHYVKLDRIYEDACDVGFSIKSDKTGGIVTWYEADTISERGELVATIFRPISESIRKFPAVKGWEIHVLND